MPSIPSPEQHSPDFARMTSSASAAMIEHLTSDEVTTLADQAWLELTPAQRDARTAIFARMFPDDIEARTRALKASLASRAIDTESVRFAELLEAFDQSTHGGGEAA